MINFIKRNRIVVLVISIFIILLSVYFIREYVASKNVYNESYLNGEDYIMSPKKYGVNEYSVININDEQMANIYLNNFRAYLHEDINYAYQLLNEEYRNKKFGSIENFINYVEQINYNNLVVERYSIDEEKKVFTIYTKDNQKYIFRIKTVMEYEVYLDDYTVEI